MMKIMELYELAKENNGLILGAIAVVLTLIQITPIKLNPWTRILWAIRKLCTGDLEEKVEALSEDVKSLREETGEREAIAARIRILRFSDELIRGNKQSREHFQQMFDEITRYNRYCNTHPNFKNELTVESCKNISNTYQALISSGAFNDKPDTERWDYE